MTRCNYTGFPQFVSLLNYSELRWLGYCCLCSRRSCFYENVSHISRIGGYLFESHLLVIVYPPLEEANEHTSQRSLE